MSNEPNDEPKIIVDEDWKSQIEREKQQADAAAASSTETPAAAESTEAAAAEPPMGELPPVSFEIHVSSIATQVLVALGQLADPIEGKPRINLDFAKFQIDMLEMLEEKTKGNLSIPENNMLKDAVHQLRMMYVAVKEQDGQK